MTTHRAIPIECCENCRYYHYGLCHRYPPVIILCNDDLKYLRPLVDKTDYCGEYGQVTYPMVLRKETT